MSSIATFIQLPEARLEELRGLAIPQERLPGPPVDRFDDFLDEHGQEVVSYYWSGYVVAVLLEYLTEQRAIDFADQQHASLVDFLSEHRGASYLILTAAHQVFLPQLAPDSFSAPELRAYFNEFTGGEDPPEVVEAMLDGIRAIRESLEKLTPDSAVLLSIG